MIFTEYLVPTDNVYFDQSYIDYLPIPRPPDPAPYPWGANTPTSNIVYFDSPYLNHWAQNPAMVPPPYPFEVSIAAHHYVIDTSFEPYRRDAFRHRSIPSQRESINLSNISGEGTVDTQGLWRRGQDDWSLGAGQQYLDRKGAEANRFYRSKGVNPWTQWQLSLLNDVKQRYAHPGQYFVRAIGVQDYAYILFQGSLFWTQNWETFTQVPGIPMDSCTGLATDGNNVYVSAGGSAGGIYSTVAGSTASTRLVIGFYNSVGYGNDRLLAGAGPGLYDITHTSGSTTLAGGGLVAGTSYATISVNALPQATRVGDIITISGDTFVISDVSPVGGIQIFVEYAVSHQTHPAGTKVVDQSWSSPDQPLLTHINPKWIWTAYASGSSQIYIGGHATVGGGINSSQAGGGSNIYRTTLNTDATALIVPSVALPLEGGEFCTALGAYLNFIFVGTNLGLRMCQTLAAFDPTGNQGDLRAGPLIPNITQPVTVPVMGFAGHGRFVYFSWGNYDSESTGIGRLDLSNFIDALAPAYASDLMVPGDGLIHLDWDPITEGPLIARQGDGTSDNPADVWTIEPGVLVPEGNIESGQISYDIPDDKVAMELDTRVTPPFAGTWQGSMALDANWSEDYRLVGSSLYHQGEGYWALPQSRAELFQVQLVLKSDPELTGQGPTLSRWTLKAFPAVATGIDISCVLLLSRMDSEKGLYRPFDPYAEYEYLEMLRQRQQVISYVEGPFTRQVVITSLDWLPNLEQNNGNRRGFQSDLIVYMKSLETEKRNT